MHHARIAELLRPFLEPADDRWPTTNDLDNISTYIDLLLRWNARINLTAIRSEDEIVTRHFGESFFLARHLFPRTNREGPEFTRANSISDSDAHRGRAALQGRVGKENKIGALAPERHTRNADPDSLADLGSGAGFPGIPLKLWVPHIHVTLIESNHKKSTFLREVVRAITLMNIDILTIRAEDLDRRFDIVTMRAVERFDKALAVASRLVAPQGRLALLIGSAQLDQAKHSLPMFRWEHPIPIPLSQSRILAVALKQT